MEVTEVKVILKEGPDRKLKAYATLTFDNCFVVRNVKVINGNKGLFVAMPSRKMREACPRCNYKNAIRSKFCNQCGGSLPVSPPRHAGPLGQGPGDEVRQSEHRDIAHPITLECREYIQKKVLDAYEAEVKRAGIVEEPVSREPWPEPRPETPKAPAPTPEPEIQKKPEDTGDIQL